MAALLRRAVFERYQCFPCAPGVAAKFFSTGGYAVVAAFPIERLAAIGLIDMVIPVRRAMAEIAAQAFLLQL